MSWVHRLLLCGRRLDREQTSSLEFSESCSVIHSEDAQPSTNMACKVLHLRSPSISPSSTGSLHHQGSQGQDDEPEQAVKAQLWDPRLLSSPSDVCAIRANSSPLLCAGARASSKGLATVSQQPHQYNTQLLSAGPNALNALRTAQASVRQARRRNSQTTVPSPGLAAILLGRHSTGSAPVVSPSSHSGCYDVRPRASSRRGSLDSRISMYCQQPIVVPQISRINNSGNNYIQTPGHISQYSHGGEQCSGAGGDSPVLS